jgi:hypothetical protein
MRQVKFKGFVVSVGLFATLLLASATAYAQYSHKGPSAPAPRTPDGKPDFSGVWNGRGNYLNQQVPEGKLPYTPAGEAAYKYNMTAAVDPGSLCVLIGIPRASVDFEAFQVLQKPDRMAFIYERSWSWRAISIDGREHPKQVDPSFFGNAVAHWDGDTLVVDVIGLKGEKVWGDSQGHPRSDAMHIVERWSRPDMDHLKVDMTLDDPKYYTQPLKITSVFDLQPFELIEQACDENNVDQYHLGPGLGTKDGTRGFDKTIK